MPVIIRKYQGSDKKVLMKCLEDLLDYISPLDPLKRSRRLPEFGEEYTKSLLEKVAKQNGAIFFAEANGKVVGCIVGVVERQTKDELLECVPTKRGIILELFVDSKHRRKGIGQMLMNKMEDYLQQAGCDIVRVEVFVPNKVAHEFYKKLNYHDRDIDMIKELQGGPTVHN